MEPKIIRPLPRFKDLLKKKGIWNECFANEVQMTDKHMEKYLTFLAISEIQIKITLRFYLTSG